MGVIAQEILEVCPEVVVQETGDSDRYSVDYGKLTGILIEAIKTLNEKIDGSSKELDSSGIKFS